MQTHHEEPFIGVNKEENNLDAPTGVKEETNDTSTDAPSDEENGSRDLVDDNDNQSCNASKQCVHSDMKANGSHENEPVLVSSESDTASKQLMLYDPKSNGSNELDVSPDPPQCQAPVLMGDNLPSRVLPSVGAFTVQCANCFKWRLIPTKKKYEEIREHILVRPFVCEAAKEWQPEISCEDPADIQQDGSRLWAIDRPSIAQPPSGWERDLRIRGQGSSKFADVYYIAPTGKRLRSMVEIQKYLMDHPEFVQQGLKMSQFSFQIPKPLQENYVRKRSARANTSCNTSNLAPSRTLEPNEVRPLSFAAPDDATVLRLGGPRLSSDSYSPEPLQNSDVRPTKWQKAAASTTPIQSSDTLHNHIKIKIGYPRPPANNVQ